jgi:hypothetical protein
MKKKEIYKKMAHFSITRNGENSTATDTNISHHFLHLGNCRIKISSKNWKTYSDKNSVYLAAKQILKNKEKTYEEIKTKYKLKDEEI